MIVASCGGTPSAQRKLFYLWYISMYKFIDNGLNELKIKLLDWTAKGIFLEHYIIRSKEGFLHYIKWLVTKISRFYWPISLGKYYDLKEKTNCVLTIVIQKNVKNWWPYSYTPLTYQRDRALLSFNQASFNIKRGTQAPAPVLVCL